MRPTDRDRLGTTDLTLLRAEHARLQAAQQIYASVEDSIRTRYGLEQGDGVDLGTGQITRNKVVPMPQRRGRDAAQR